MGKKNKRLTDLFKAAAEPLANVTAPAIVRMRCPAGKYAIAATEAEVHIDGARIAGGEGRFEFDLFAEAWVEIRIIRS